MNQAASASVSPVTADEGPSIVLGCEMFVRWKRKRRRDDTSGFGNARTVTPQWLRSAVIVESIRVDGRPKQRILKYLGSIRECYLDPDNHASIYHWGYFWRSVDANLEQLELSDVDRVRIVAVLEDVVPRPDMAEHAQRVTALCSR